jgi:hypothetical protein
VVRCLLPGRQLKLHATLSGDRVSGYNTGPRSGTGPGRGPVFLEVAVAKLKLVVEFECPDTSAVEVDDLADQLDDYLDAFREEYPDVRIEPVDLVSPILERIQILRKAGLPVSFLWDGEQGYRFRVRKEWATDYLTEGAAWEWLQNFKMEVV